MARNYNIYRRLIFEMWTYRELIWNLTITDLKNKYQNTSIGFLWSILSPFLLAIVLYLVFRNLFQQEEDFAIYLLVGIMAWRFFNNGTMSSLYTIVSKASLVTKVYIPRQILVLATVLSSLISSMLEFLILVPIIFVLTGSIPVTIILVPSLLLLYFWFILGVAFFLSASYVYFRDLNQIWEVMLTILFFLCPIVYPLSIINPALLPYYMLNPLTRFIIMFRGLMVTGDLPSTSSIVVVLGSGTLIFLLGIFTFNRLQRRFAEAL